MSKAVFLFTLWVKFSSLSSLFSLFFLAFILPAIFASVAPDGKSADMLIGLINGPTLAMSIAYSFMQDNIANTRQLNDGEYLSLLFSRPLTRTHYVISKWLAGACGVSLIMLINLIVFNTFQSIQGRNSYAELSNWSLANLALNGLSYSALIVLIRSFPMRLGITIFVIMVYASLVGPALNFSFTNYETNYPVVFYFFQALVYISNFLHQFIFPGIDLYETFNTTRFSWLPLITYISNVSLYVLLASFLLNRREFSYGED